MAEKQANWGGAREGAGAKSKWQSEGGTKLVRIPIAIEPQVLEAARVIDAGVRLIRADLLEETVTKSSYDEYVTKSSQRIQQLDQELDQLRQERERLETLLKACQASRQELPDLEAMRDRVLSRWRVQKRSETKERIKEALDQLIALVQRSS